MERRLLFLFVVICLTGIPALAQGWESESWSGQLESRPDDPHGAVLWAWTRDEPSALVEGAIRYLTSEAPAEWRVQFWRVAAEEALEVGNLEGLARLAEAALREQSLSSLAASAKDALAEARRELGDLDGARTLWDEMHFLRNWRVIGPFTNKADAGFHQVFPPEEGEVSGTVVGMGGRPLQWHELKEVDWKGWCALEACLGGDSENVYYAATSLQSERSQEAWFGLDRSGAAKVWLNGKQIFENAAYRPKGRFTPDFERFPARLQAGSNTVILKLAVNSQVEGTFRLRILEEATGRPIALRADPSDVVWTELQSDRFPEAKVPELEAIEKTPEGPEKTLFRARTLVAIGRELEAAELLLEAYNSEPSSSLLGWFAYRACRVASLDSEASTLLASFARLEDGPTRLLAERISEIPDVQRRVKEARELAKLFPESPSALREAFAACLAANLEAEGLKYLEGLIVVASGDDYVSGYSSIMRRMRRSQHARDLVERLLEKRPGSIDLLRTAAYLAMAQDQFGPARQFAIRALEVGASRGAYLSSLGRMDLKENRWLEAVRYFEEALEYSPQAAGLWEQLGDARKELGQNDEAAAAFTRSLDYGPSSLVRHKLADATNTRPVAELVEPIPLEPLLKKAESSPIATGGRIILDEGVVILWPDFSYEERFRMVYEVQDQETAKSFQRLPRDFSGRGETVQVYRAALVKPDGKEVDNSEYVDEAGFRFPSVAAGDRLEIEYVLNGRKGGGWENDYWTQWAFDGEYPSLRSQLTLITPAEMTLYHREHGGLGKPTVRTEQEWAITQWNLEDIARLGVGDSNLPAVDRSRWVDVSTVPSWNAVAKWYSELSADRCKADAPSRAKALELTRDVDSELDKIRVLRNFLARDLQYQTTPFRNSAFIPTEGARVLQDGYGDCKDKAAMLTAMLAEVGIRSRIALVSSRSLGLTDHLPSPRFHHAINIIETSLGPLWVDATSPMLEFDMLDTSLYGARALVVGPETQNLVSIPLPEAKRDYVGSQVEARLAENGDLSGTLSVEYRGNPASLMRAALSSLPEEGRDQALNLVLPRILQEAKANDIQIEDLELIDKPLRLEFEFEQTGAAKVAGAILICDPPWTRLTRLQEAINSAVNLEGSFEIGNIRTQRQSSTTLEIPRGWAVLESPKPARGEAPFGKFEFECEIGERVLSLAMASEFRVMRVDETDAADFTSFLKEHEEALDQPLILKRL